MDIMLNIVDIPIAPIAAVGDRETQANRLYNKAYLLLEDDIDYANLPNETISSEARTMAALNLKENATGFVEISFVKHTAGHTSEGSEGDITSEVTNTISGTLGGRRTVIDNLIESNLGKSFLLRIKHLNLLVKSRLLLRHYSALLFKLISLYDKLFFLAYQLGLLFIILHLGVKHGKGYDENKDQQ